MAAVPPAALDFAVPDPRGVATAALLVLRGAEQLINGEREQRGGEGGREGEGKRKREGEMPFSHECTHVLLCAYINNLQHLLHYPQQYPMPTYPTPRLCAWSTRRPTYPTLVHRPMLSDPLPGKCVEPWFRRF